MFPPRMDRVAGRFRQMIGRRSPDTGSLIPASEIDLMQEAESLLKQARDAAAQGDKLRAHLMTSIAREFEARAYGHQAQAA